jgi:hypothetical protein
MQGFIGYVVGIALLPRKTTRRLLEDPHRLRQTTAASLLMGVLYTASVFIGYLHGFGAVMEPWLPIPARDYYLWETFFTTRPSSSSSGRQGWSPKRRPARGHEG